MGKKFIQFFVPISPCSAPDALGRSANRNTKTATTVVTVDTARTGNTRPNSYADTSILPGNYLDFNSCIYVTMSLAKPLTSANELALQARKSATRVPTAQKVNFDFFQTFGFIY
jgi:hypothetical protein